MAIPLRGTLMGNRGILHDNQGRLGKPRWRHRNWVCCCLSFKGRQREIMAPGRYTELFFHDEAVALAAGHRPCAECRRPSFTAFRDAFAAANGCAPRAEDMDGRLHADRLLPARRGQRRHEAEARVLPDGVFILWNGGPHVLQDDAALPFSAQGYGPPCTRPLGSVWVLTPRCTVATLAEGYQPAIGNTRIPPDREIG